MKDDLQTILIVDDMSENINILNSLLNDKYKIKAAKSGAEALKVVRKISKPDLILLDIMMPEMDGYDVIRELKSDNSTKDIPVIFISAKGDTNDETLGFSLGAADYIIKPINPPVVLARVATHLALHEKQQYLEHRIEVETQKRLENEKLLLRQSRLAAMGEMMSAITHQWKQPLNVISTVSMSLRIFSELDGINLKQLLKELDIVDNNIRFMSQTMDDFKNFFKADKERYEFHVVQEVNSIVAMLEPIMKSHHIEVEVDIEDDLKGYGINSEFKQVILNLLANAKDAIVEYREKEDKQFAGKIEVIGKSSENNTVLTIIDNGGGISEDIIGDIFEDYFSTKNDKGTGIGLSMSKLIIEEQMNGKISAHNSEDGATFVLEFPSSKI